ncbi:MAG: hypothetical protein E7633_00590 [Ruminococcaceae bacterium]|nr:hypothetical protein [Oscillospiraceae bacterium]
MKHKKILSLFLAAIMILSFSTMFVSANTRSVGYPQSWVNVGETIELSLSSGVLYATWSSSDPSIATVSPSGEVTGVSCGSVTITTVCDYTTGGSETFTTYIDVYDNRGIVNGEEYYIMNTTTKKNLSLSSASTANNTGIGLVARSNSTMQRWKLTQQSTGKYTFVSMYNSTTKGMYANSSTNDVYLYTVGSSATYFEIERINTRNSDTDSGYQGTYLIRYGSKYLAASTTTDVYLASTLNTNCYWSLSRVDKGTADLFSFDSRQYGGTHATTGSDDKFETTLGDLGYQATAYNNDTAGSAFTKLQSGSVFVFRGHGGAGKILFYQTTDSNFTGAILANELVSSSVSAKYKISAYTTTDTDTLSNNALKSMRCVLYVGCSTAKNYKSYGNLVDETYNQGAHFVMGTLRDIKSEYNGYWLRYFLDAIDRGDNIQEAVSWANNSVGPVTDEDETQTFVYPYYIVGDMYQYLD